MLAYLGATVAFSRRSAAILGQTQVKLGSLHSIDVDHDAIEYARLAQQTIGARRQVSNEFAVYAQDRLTVLTHDARSTVGINVIGSLVFAVATDNVAALFHAGKAIVQDSNAKADEVTSQNQQELRLQNAYANWQRLGIDAFSRRTDLTMALKEKYPKLSWEFMMPSSPEPASTRR
jgi:hypothetical protein